MALRRIAAITYGIISLGVVAFQVALAAGAPWGAYAMGGAFPGQFPLALRVGALVQAALLAGMAVVILARAGLILPRWARVSRWLAWVVVAFAALSLVLNLITPSQGNERYGRRRHFSCLSAAPSWHSQVHQRLPLRSAESRLL